MKKNRENRGRVQVININPYTLQTERRTVKQTDVKLRREPTSGSRQSVGPRALAVEAQYLYLRDLDPPVGVFVCTLIHPICHRLMESSYFTLTLNPAIKTFGHTDKCTSICNSAVSYHLNRRIEGGRKRTRYNQSCLPRHTSTYPLDAHFPVGSAEMARVGIQYLGKNGFDPFVKTAPLRCYELVHPPTAVEGSARELGGGWAGTCLVVKPSLGVQPVKVLAICLSSPQLHVSDFEIAPDCRPVRWTTGSGVLYGLTMTFIIRQPIIVRNE